MLVKEFMTEGVECVHPGATMQHAAERMKELDIGALPVCEDDRLVGMITDRDITVRATAENRDPGQTCVRDLMTPNVRFCFEDDPAREAAHKMEHHQVRRLVVLDHDKRLRGIVSLGDLAVKTRDEELSGETLRHVSEPAHPAR